MAGEPVAVVENPYASATLIGPIPNGGTNLYSYWVDDDNRMYYVSGGILHVIDGLSGEPIDETTVAYGFQRGTNCCAYKTSSSESVWVVILPNGERTGEITLNYTQLAIGYRNGIIGIAEKSDDYAAAQVYTYDNAGNLLNTLRNLSCFIIYVVSPIDARTIAFLRVNAIGLSEMPKYSYVIVTTAGVTSTDIAIGYNVDQYDAIHQHTIRFLGCDQTRYYVEARLVDPQSSSTLTANRVVIATPIDNQTAQETIESYSESIIYNSSSGYTTQQFQPNTNGTVTRMRTVDNETVTEIVDLSTMSVLYSDDIQPVPMVGITENTGYLWIPNSGAWQKAAAGWVMYATSVVPEGFTGKLGYTAHNVSVGKQGLVIVMFEGGPENAG